MGRGAAQRGWGVLGRVLSPWRALARALLSDAAPCSGSSREATPHAKGTVTWCQLDVQARPLRAGKNVLFPLLKVINMVLSPDK